MARVTVEDCLEHVDNRFELVMLSIANAEIVEDEPLFAAFEDESNEAN